jgi:hypothetical protein
LTSGSVSVRPGFPQNEVGVESQSSVQSFQEKATRVIQRLDRRLVSVNSRPPKLVV